jgi:dTDP-glucose 4,6-dehydratase
LQNSGRSSKTILVTGGAGFIGSALVRHLVSRGDRVVNVDALTYAGNLDSIAAPMAAAHHIFVHADIVDADALASVFAVHRPGAVVHLAAESHVVGTFTLLQAARRHWLSLSADERAKFRFVHVSTDEVFGALGDEGYFDEETAYNPRSPYSASKAGSDHLARAWHHTYGLPVIVTNCSNNFGPFQFPEKLIPLMILTALREGQLPVYGDGSNVRDWIYVEDHVEGIVAALDRGVPGHTYLFGGDSERRNIDVVRAICAAMDDLRPAGTPHDRLITFVTDRPGHDYRYAIDASVAKRDLGWGPRHTFEQGLRATVEWYFTNTEWCSRVQSGEYAGERLGLSEKSGCAP